MAARRFGAREIVDPRPYAVGSIIETYNKYPHTGPILPAMGYSPQQIAELEQTINNTPCALVVIATPVNLGKIVHINKPLVCVRYELEERTWPDLAAVLQAHLSGQAAQ